MGDNTELHPTGSSHHRFHFLDALRGIAAILVVFSHVPPFIVFRPVHSARIAVDFFFCLSGFVLAFSYEKRLQDTLTLGRFFAARVIRLYPTYLLGIALGIVPLLAFDLPAHMSYRIYLRLGGLIFLQTWMLPPLNVWHHLMLFPLDLPAWSMFFEMLANIAYGWMVRRGLAGTRVLAVMVLGSFVAICAWLYVGGTIDIGALGNRSSLMGIFRVAFSFFAGVLVYRLFRRQGAPHWAPLPSAVVALATAMTMIFLLIAPLAAMQTKFFNQVTVGGLCPCILYLGARCRLSALWHGACSFLGDLSYPLYLLHVPLLGALSIPWITRAANRHPAAQPMMVCGVLVVAGAVSVLASKYYDVPMRAFLARRYNARLLKQRAA